MCSPLSTACRCRVNVTACLGRAASRRVGGPCPTSTRPASNCSTLTRRPSEWYCRRRPAPVDLGETRPTSSATSRTMTSAPTQNAVKVKVSVKVVVGLDTLTFKSTDAILFSTTGRRTTALIIDRSGRTEHDIGLYDICSCVHLYD